MRWLGHVSLLVVTTGSFACSRQDAGPYTGDGVLVLEVGGDRSSLREALVAAGVAVAPAAQRERVEDAESQQDPRAPDVESEPPPRSAPSAADHFVVSLARGQTLIHLAKQHLGNGNRFREILARNGWSEADARRLPEGQLVKIPLESARSAAPR